MLNEPLFFSGDGVFVTKANNWLGSSSGSWLSSLRGSSGLLFSSSTAPLLLLSFSSAAVALRLPFFRASTGDRMGALPNSESSLAAGSSGRSGGTSNRSSSSVDGDSGFVVVLFLEALNSDLSSA